MLPFISRRQATPKFKRNGTTATWLWFVPGVRQYNNRRLPKRLNFTPALKRLNVTSHPRVLVAAGATSFIDMAGDEKKV